MWYSLKDKEPYDKNQEYFLRNGGDKYIGWWDNEEKEFYMIKEGNARLSYFEKEEFPNIEWWDEEASNQDDLWEEVRNEMMAYRDFGRTAARNCAKKYQLIRK